MISNEHTYFTMKMAGLKVGVEAPTSRTKMFCYHWIIDEITKPDICISITEEDVKKEIATYEAKGVVNEERVFSDDLRRVTVYVNNMNVAFIETFLVYKRIAEAALPFNIFLMHGAAIAYDNNVYMFTAPSGTGKTTHIKQWLSRLPGSYVVNGDKPLIKVTEEGIFACGTPWCGKEELGSDTIVRLNSIVLMERGDLNTINEISFSKAYVYLLRQVYIPEDSKKAKRTLELLSQLNMKVRFFKFVFNNFKDDCFEVAYKALCGKI